MDIKFFNLHFFSFSLGSCHLLKEAAKMVQPSLRREGFSSIPDVTWDDVGGLDSLRREFDHCIIRCIKNPEDYEVSTELHLLTQRTVFYTSYTEL